ncbi:hypothetical protein [Paraburkholderia sp. GAS82]|uniref:hypothetical protein n=1 Tax=Paraburkholderia sp. GAS82 TaxID=3035137 RepID=UPI003D23AC45
MEHTLIVTANDLEDFADMRESQAAIPELIWLLVNESVPSLLECRIPYGDSVNQPGWDGLIETGTNFKHYMPAGKSFWEIGTGDDPQGKATADFKKRTESMPLEERQNASYVFVTPRAAGTGGWSEPAQTKWRDARSQSGWQRIIIIDGQRLADWLREFPAVGKWLFKKIGLVRASTGFSTPAEHWDNLRQVSRAGDPPLPAEIFLVGRDKAVTQLRRLFDGESSKLVLATESENDAEDFVAAFLEKLEPVERQLLCGRCLFVHDADAWASFANLRSSHVLVASPKLDILRDEQLHMAAQKGKHAVVVPVSGAWARASADLVPLRSPSAHTLSSTLRDANFDFDHARELGAAGGLSLSALKRYIRGVGQFPPYATWEKARVLAHAQLLGAWVGDNEHDQKAVETMVAQPYADWCETARAETLRSDTPLIQRNERWRTISRGEAWSGLGPRLTDADLDRFQSLAVRVLSEVDPKFELATEEHYRAAVYGKVLLHSDALRSGVAESLALLGSRPGALTSCSHGKAENVAYATVRDLLNGVGWKRWASMNSLLPMLAEAAPGAFMAAIEEALRDLSVSPFLDVFKQESNGFGGWNYMTGVLWGLESLAWNPDYLTRVTAILGDLSEIDPGGNWVNRPKNSLTSIFLPWLPQTAASVPRRKVAVETILKERPAVCWKLLLSLLPTTFGNTSGTYRPTWRPYVPDEWNDIVSPADNLQQVLNYAELAIGVAAKDLPKLVELVEYLPDLPAAANSDVLALLHSPVVTEAPEASRLPLWEALLAIANKHRKFADAQWAMQSDAVQKIEAAAIGLAPRSAQLLNRRLFTETDIDLYDEGDDFEAQAHKLEEERQRIVKQLLDEGGVAGILDFVREVESPRKVGFALGKLASSEMDEALLPEYLEAADKPLSALIAAFVVARHNDQQWVWVDAQLDAAWSVEHRLAFLKLLPFEPETWRRAERSLHNDVGRYWQEVSVNPWPLDEPALVEAVHDLLSHGRALGAVSCIARLVHKKATFAPELALNALLEALRSPVGQDRIDQYAIQEIILWLQANLPTDSEELFKVEWNYLRLLERHRGHGPKTLERRLASDAGFFSQLIALLYRSDKPEKRVELTSEDENIAQNASRLLRGWRTIPGGEDGAQFDGQRFSSWLSEVKRQTDETGHVRFAMNRIGQALAYAPTDPGGLWIHKSLAEALNAKDANEMRSGLVTGLYNKRGVHGFSAGAAEREIAAGYREKAAQAEADGFHRLADSMRILVQNYEHDAAREEESNPYSD